MPFSSLFNRKGSRKNNQAKDKTSEETKASVGNGCSDVKNSETRSETGIINAQQIIKQEGKPMEVIRSVSEESETPLSAQYIAPAVSDIKLKEDAKIDVDQTEEEEKHSLDSQVESSKSLNPQNINLKLSDESLDELQNSGSLTPQVTATTTTKCHNGIIDCQMDDIGKLPVQPDPDSTLEKSEIGGGGESQENLNSTVQGNVIVENSSNFKQERLHLEVSTGVSAKEENLENKNEEPEVSDNATVSANESDDTKKDMLECSESVCSSLTTVRSIIESVTNKTGIREHESAVDFLKTKFNSEEYETNEPEINTALSSESNNHYAKVSNEEESEMDTQIDSSDSSTVLAAKTTVVDQFQEKVYDSGGGEILPETDMTVYSLCDTKAEQATNDCENYERFVDQMENIAAVEDKMENFTSVEDKMENFTAGEDDKDQNNLDSNEEQDRDQDKIHNESIFPKDDAEIDSQKAQQESNVKTSVDAELQFIESSSSKTRNLSEAECSSSESLNKGKVKQSIEEQGTQSETVAASASIPSLTSAIDSKEQNIESHEERQKDQENSSERLDDKQLSTESLKDRTDIFEISPDVVRTEENDLFIKTDIQSEVVTSEPTTPLDDGFDSFPSECSDFVGGQRKLMMGEQYSTPSWKVGYLQVKLPTKSRGRGKLKVWRQRWVVIQMDEFVKDAKDPSLMINIYASECSNVRRHSALFWSTISASKTVIYRSQSRTHKYAFSISVDHEVILHLAADSETTSQEWMTAIRNLLWPPSPVLQLEKVLNGSEFEVSVIDNDFSFHAGLLGTYGIMKVTSNKIILSHPQTDHVIQEWYLNTLDKFQLLPQNKEEDSFKVVIMHTGQDSSTGSGQIILFCSDAVSMLQTIASTIHKLLQYRTAAGKDHNQKELAELAEWLTPAMSQAEPAEDYYKVPRRQIRSLLDIPNFSFEKPLSAEVPYHHSQEVTTKRPSMLPSATSASTFSHDSGISLATQPDDFLNCSVTSFTIGGRPVRNHTSSESSDGFSPPSTPEIPRKKEETEAV